MPTKIVNSCKSSKFISTKGHFIYTKQEYKHTITSPTEHEKEKP